MSTLVCEVSQHAVLLEPISSSHVREHDMGQIWDYLQGNLPGFLGGCLGRS